MSYDNFYSFSQHKCAEKKQNVHNYLTYCENVITLRINILTAGKRD